MKRIYLMSVGALFAASAAFANMDSRPTVLPVSAQDRTEAEMSRELQKLGYSNLSDVELRGDVYTATAYWNGKPLSLKIDQADGKIWTAGGEVEAIPNNRDATIAEVTSALESLGYHDVHDMTKAGSVFRGKAMRDGMSYMLRVDAGTGVVTTLDDRTQETVGNAGQMSDREIVASLADLGYHGGHSVEREGNVISVQAMHEGEKVDLNIDAENGAITVVN